MAVQLELTKAASKAFLELNQDPQANYIRISAGQSCGCGKMGFKMQWDNQKRFGDTVVKSAGVPLLLDRDTKARINGGTIDFSDEAMTRGFRITAPAATAGTGCGCGSH